MDSFSTTLSVYSGPIKRKGNKDGKWHQRYLKLDGIILQIAHDKDFTHIDRTLSLSGNVDVQIELNSPIHKFTLITESSGINEFCATTSAELHKWVQIIKSATPAPTPISMSSFKILSVVGRGYYGKVMLAEKLDTGHLYAIKSLQKNRLAELSAFDSVSAERNILMKIKHPFIVQLCFAFQSPTKFYLGLEYAAGGELFYHMTRLQTIELDNARLYIAEIALALEHMHNLGIVYRDLKPENVLLDAEGHIKLTDFGLAKELSPTGTASTFCGTSEYLAPEVVQKGPYGKEIDIWALGVLAYEMIFGGTPFSSDNIVEMFDSICNKPPLFPDGLDERITDFLLKLLTKDPSQRITIKELKEHSFFEGFDWNLVYQRAYQPSFIPDTKDLTKPINFDPEFTQEIASDSFVAPINGDLSHVQGFSFVETKF